jgi:hypothetical protein
MLNQTLSEITTVEKYCFLGPRHCNENPIYVFPEKELRGLSTNFHIHVSVTEHITVLAASRRKSLGYVVSAAHIGGYHAVPGSGIVSRAVARVPRLFPVAVIVLAVFGRDDELRDVS